MISFKCSNVVYYEGRPLTIRSGTFFHSDCSDAISCKCKTIAAWAHCAAGCKFSLSACISAVVRTIVHRASRAVLMYSILYFKSPFLENRDILSVSSLRSGPQAGRVTRWRVLGEREKYYGMKCIQFTGFSARTISQCGIA